MNRLIASGVAATTAVLAAGALAAGTLSVSREVTVDRPPATVWKLLGEFNALDVWLPPVLNSAFTGSATQAGAVRILDLGNEASVTEQLLAYSGADRRYTYTFLKSPLPVKNYVATLELSAAPEGKTLIKWHSTFDAAGVPDEQAKQAILGIYDAGLAKAAAIFRK
jgi:mxaD protein